MNITNSFWLYFKMQRIISFFSTRLHKKVLYELSLNLLGSIFKMVGGDLLLGNELVSEWQADKFQCLGSVCFGHQGMYLQTIQ